MASEGQKWPSDDFRRPKMARVSNFSCLFIKDFDKICRKVQTLKSNVLHLCGPHLHDPICSFSLEGKNGWGTNLKS